MMDEPDPTIDADKTPDNDPSSNGITISGDAPAIHNYSQDYRPASKHTFDESASASASAPTNPMMISGSTSSSDNIANTGKESNEENAKPKTDTPTIAKGTAPQPLAMFCGQCTTSDGATPAYNPQAMMTMLTKVPVKKKNRGMARHMVFVSNKVEIVTDDDDTMMMTDDSGDISMMDLSLDDQPQVSVPIAIAPSTKTVAPFNDQPQVSVPIEIAPSTKTVTLFIANLDTQSQLLLVNSVLDSADGISSVKTYFQLTNDKGYNGDNDDDVENSRPKSKTVDLVYDPIRASVERLIESLEALGLRVSILQRSKRVPRQIKRNRKKSMKDQSFLFEGGVCSPASVTQASSRNSKKCRSSFYVEGICCAAEVPQVTDILRKLAVEKVSINITSRMVYVDHYADRITAADLAKELSDEGFDATVRKDGGLSRSFNKKVSNSAGKSTKTANQARIGDASTMAQAASPESNPQHGRQRRSNPTLTFVESTIMAPCLETVEDIEHIKEIFEKCNFLHKAKIRHFSPNLASRTVKIEHNFKVISAQNVADGLMDVGGFSNVTVLIDGFKEGRIMPEMAAGGGLDSLSLGEYSWKDRQLRRMKFCLPKGLSINIVLSGFFWAISLIGEFVDQWDYLKYAGLFAVMFGIPTVAKKAFRTLKRRHFDANCMMVTAALGALALQEYDEAASVSFLFSISEFLEDKATRRARKALDTIVNLRPDHANLIDPDSGEIDMIPASDLEVGDLVSVRTGDKIPSDGVVVEGESEVDESSLTGESVLISKVIGNTVSGGTINAGSTCLKIRMTALVEDSAVARLVKLVEESATNSSQTEQIVDAFAKSYTPTVICAAFLMCTIPWLISAEEGRRWTLNGLIIVVIACPCALTISTPVTYAAGLAATAQNGVIVKGGARLEALGSIKTAVFDKTGTLTEGKFCLLHLDTVGNHKTRREVLALLSLMEAPSSHPLAVTLIDAAKNEGVTRPKNSVVLGHSILKGEGVTAFVDGEEVFVGNTRLIKRLGFYDELESDHKNRAIEWNDKGGTVGFLAIKGKGILAMFCVADGVRKEARSVVTALLNDGVNVLMLTGDGDGAAKAVARDVGLPAECVHSQYLPEDKLHHVASMLGSSKRKGHVLSKKELLLFCGDGVNDAPALTIADIGVAMGEGAALAMEMSDVTLMDSNLSKLLLSMRIGAKVIATVKENIAFSVVAKIVAIALTFAGKMSLLAAIVSDVGVMLIVSINGMKLLPSGTTPCCSRRRTYRKLPMVSSPRSEIV